MAANFGYNEQYVDEMLDMERLFAHLEYLKENPPAGTLIKAYFDAQAEVNNNHSSSSIAGSVSSYKYKSYDNKTEQQNMDRKQINTLCANLGVNINQLPKKPKRKVIRFD